MREKPRGTPSPELARFAWPLSLLCTATAFLAIHAIAAHVAAPPMIAFAVGFSCVAAATLAVSRFAPDSARVLIPILLATIALLSFAFFARTPGWPLALAVSLALWAAGSALGARVGARIAQPGHILFVAGASSLADLFSVLSPSGPSAAIVESEAALSVAAVSWPMLGTRAIEPLLGVGDIVFSGLYLACARKHDLPLRRTMFALASGYGVTMLTVLVFQTAVPALPFLGGAVLAAHPETRRPPVADRRRGLVVLSVMAGVFLLLLLRPHD